MVRLKVEFYTGPKCNVHCDYCLSKQSEEKSTLQHADKVFDFLNLLNHDDVEFLFVGGEPLVNWDEIKSILDRTGKEVRINIQTNGILLDFSIIGYLNKFDNVTYNISLDGPREIHEQYREGFDEILKNIEKIKLYSKAKIQLNSVIDKDRLQSMDNIYKFLSQYGDVFFIPMIQLNHDKEFAEQFDKICKKLNTLDSGVVLPRVILKDFNNIGGRLIENQTFTWLDVDWDTVNIEEVKNFLNKFFEKKVHVHYYQSLGESWEKRRFKNVRI